MSNIETKLRLILIFVQQYYLNKNKKKFDLFCAIENNLQNFSMDYISKLIKRLDKEVEFINSKIRKEKVIFT